jgi:hypothetical protein
MKLEICKRCCSAVGIAIDQFNFTVDGEDDFSYSTWVYYDRINDWKNCFTFRTDCKKLNEVLKEKKYPISIDSYYGEMVIDELTNEEKEFIESLQVSDDCPFMFEHNVLK